MEGLSPRLPKVRHLAWSFSSPDPNALVYMVDRLQYDILRMLLFIEYIVPDGGKRGSVKARASQIIVTIRPVGSVVRLSG